MNMIELFLSVCLNLAVMDCTTIEHKWDHELPYQGTVVTLASYSDNTHEVGFNRDVLFYTPFERQGLSVRVLTLLSLEGTEYTSRERYSLCRSLAKKQGVPTKVAKVSCQ
jgi:hypothetical protein